MKWSLSIFLQWSVIKSILTNILFVPKIHLRFRRKWRECFDVNNPFKKKLERNQKYYREISQSDKNSSKMNYKLAKKNNKYNNLDWKMMCQDNVYFLVEDVQRVCS